jgi:hypothetical protein
MGNVRGQAGACGRKADHPSGGKPGERTLPEPPDHRTAIGPRRPPTQRRPNSREPTLQGGWRALRRRGRDSNPRWTERPTTVSRPLVSGHVRTATGWTASTPSLSLIASWRRPSSSHRPTSRHRLSAPPREAAIRTRPASRVLIGGTSMRYLRHIWPGASRPGTPEVPGISGAVRGLVPSPENRGVPGSSPGLAIRNPAFQRDFLVFG